MSTDRYQLNLMTSRDSASLIFNKVMDHDTVQVTRDKWWSYLLKYKIVFVEFSLFKLESKWNSRESIILVDDDQNNHQLQSLCCDQMETRVLHMFPHSSRCQR